MIQSVILSVFHSWFKTLQGTSWSKGRMPNSIFFSAGSRTSDLLFNSWSNERPWVAQKTRKVLTQAPGIEKSLFFHPFPETLWEDSNPILTDLCSQVMESELETQN